ncbi:MAG: DUF6268 family outer membrane beta-barrel protein [Sulfurimonadaceae bacterium]|jgi:hypothetical protein|nr:DUF6268 family outer membrane beta-barrel protein [Sulfurimonadaceae bacterium]
MKKIILACVLPLIVFAQEEKKTLLDTLLEPKITYETAYLNDAKVGGTDGTVRVFKNNLKVNIADASVSYSNWRFNWDSVENLPFGNKIDTPLEQIHELEVRMNFPKLINEKWFMLTSISANTTFEKEMSDSYGANIFAMLSYQMDMEHSFQFGAFANYHPIKTLALPVMSYSYRANEKDGWQFIFGFPITHVGYFVDKNTLLRLGLMFSQSLVRLADDNVVQKSGYAEAMDYMSNLGITYVVNKNFKLHADILYTLAREFTIYDKDANKVQKEDIENNFGVNLRLVYSF